MGTLRIGVCFDADVLTQSRASLSSLDVLLFPELMDGGYAALQHGKPPHSYLDDFLLSLRTASQKLSCTLVAGSTFLHFGTRRPTNTSLVFRNGRLIHRYDKIHLFKPTGDTKFFGGGKLDTKIFTIGKDSHRLRAGVVLCYDLRFPELTRTLALQGMQILFVPARWPSARDEAWQTLLKARAIENQIFVVGCDSLDEEGGYSYAFDPLGKMIFSNRIRYKKKLHTFNIDLNALEDARRPHQNLNEAVVLKKLFVNRKQRS
jgi:omega-amidase